MEETLVFYPTLVLVFLVVGYDLLVPIAVIIASDATEWIDWTEGLNSRLIMLVIGVIV